MTRIGFAYNVKPVTGTTSATQDHPTVHAAETRRSPSQRSSTDNGNAADRRDSSDADADPDDEFAEWDSIETIDAVATALRALGEVIRLEADDDFPARVRDARPDIVFNIAEGSRGPNREAHVPAILEFLGVPYSGSDPFTLSLCLEKSRAKETLAFYGVPTPPFARITALPQLDVLARRAFPMFVKPVHEGSSKGITERSLCRDFGELRNQTGFLLERYRQPVLVEEWLPGEEFTCAILGNGGECAVLPVVGMRFEGLPTGALPIFGYQAKWTWDTREHPLSIYEVPAHIEDGMKAALEDVALRTYAALGCRDWGRVDLRLDSRGMPNVVEVNPLPGIAPDPDDHSCFPMAARAAGMSYDELIQRCLVLAAARYGIRIDGAPDFPSLPRRTPPRGVSAYGAAPGRR